MNNRKKIFILFGIILFVICAIVAIYFFNRNYMSEIKYSEVVNKIENKDSFVLLLSQTTCSHCAMYKPKLKRVSNKYKVNVYYLETDLLSKEQTEDIKKYFSFNGTPTTVFVINGEEKTAASRINGDVSEDKIVAKFKNNGFIN